jgi:lysophospholipase L1-like esterase
MPPLHHDANPPPPPPEVPRRPPYDSCNTNANANAKTNMHSPLETHVRSMDLCSHNDNLLRESPGWHFLQWWTFGLILPLGMLVWWRTHRIVYVIGSIFLIPAIAFAQAGFYVLRYRIKYANCPLPKAPSHGVVKVVASTATTSTSNSEQPVIGYDDDYDACKTTNESETTPLRLLVIGDSLAIGVGQSRNHTPVMPESIAKSLSRAMGGRPVLWTCHGAPGASAGWIVRELERSINQGQFPKLQKTTTTTTTKSTKNNMGETESETSASSDDDSVYSSEESHAWHDRLKQERIRFDPSVVGPFDIAVVLTGSNDVKSAFFPFLMRGEDVKFRREAQLRGGGYAMELRRVLEVLNRGMRIRLETLRESAEKVRGNVLERMGQSQTNLMPHAPQNQNQPLQQQSPSARFQRTTPTLRKSISSRHSSSINTSDATTHSPNSTSTSTSRSPMPLFPMVVLPGMPARSLPLFQMAPLRWLAVPAIDIMDTHKRQLSENHQGEVLFVNSPSVQEMQEFDQQQGPYWQHASQDKVLLNSRDISRKEARKIHADMRLYFSRMDPNDDQGSTSVSSRTTPKPPQKGMFSIDGIHPNDTCYNFWGRYIGHAIVQEWKQKQSTSSC